MQTILKSIICAGLLLCLVTESKAQWGYNKVVGDGNVTTKSVSTGDYDEIKVVGSMDVHLEKRRKYIRNYR